MLFGHATNARLAYRQGRLDQALAEAEQALADDPYCVEALWVSALVQMRRSQAQPMARTFRTLLQVRSADWVLAALREEFRRAGPATMSTETGFALGNVLRTKLPSLGPALPSAHRRATHPFINVMGTSYSRGFGSSTAFFPLFIGTGFTILNLTDESAALARAKFKANLARVDPARNTLLVMGGDAYCHMFNLIGTRPSGPSEPTEDDFPAMDQAAARHEAILADAQKVIRGQVMLLGATPSPHPHINQLGRHLNARLKALCQRLGVVFLDWWDELADPATGVLRAEYCANSMVSDPHFSLATNPRFIQLLKRDGLLPSEAPDACSYDWTHVFECEVEPSERTRIWCEPAVTPNNAFKSAKIAASFVGGHLADLACLLLAGAPDAKVAMLNVRDGLLPVSVPPQLHTGCVAFTDTTENEMTAQAVLDFHGRTDVQLRRWTDTTAETLDGLAIEVALIATHEGTLEDDERRAEAFLRRIGPGASVVMMTPDPERLSRLDLGGRQVAKAIPVGNRHILPPWRDMRLCLLGPAAAGA